MLSVFYTLSFCILTKTLVTYLSIVRKLRLINLCNLPTTTQIQDCLTLKSLLILCYGIYFSSQNPGYFLRNSTPMYRERMNKAGLTAIFRKWQVPGNLDFGMVLFPELLRAASLCLNCANIFICAEHLLSFWESGILVCAS